MDASLLSRAIAMENNWMLNDCKKWEFLNALGVCRFCLLAIMGKLESEVERLSAEGLNADLSDPECAGCSFRKTTVSANLLSLERRAACPRCSRLYLAADQASLDALPHNQHQTTKQLRQHLLDKRQ